MKTRSAYRLVGVLWALLFAPLVTYAVLGALVGVLWLFVFGDGPWPENLDATVLAIGGITFVAAVAVCVAAADRWGRSREREVAEVTPQEAQRILVLGGVPCVLIGLLVLAYGQHSAQQRQGQAQWERQAANLAAALNARHAIADLVVTRTDDRGVNVRVETSGGAAGAYRLSWKVNGVIYDEILSRTEPPIELSQTAGVLGFRFSIDELAARYRDGFLSGGGVLVDETFELIVTLEPIFRVEDTQDWPAYERQRWERGDRLTDSSRRTELGAAFIVRRDGALEHRTP